MATVDVEPTYIIQVTDDSVEVKYFQKYVTLKRVKVTDQISQAKQGLRGQMIRAAVLMRMNGIKAHARPLEVI